MGQGSSKKSEEKEWKSPVSLYNRNERSIASGNPQILSVSPSGKSPTTLKYNLSVTAPSHGTSICYTGPAPSTTGYSLVSNDTEQMFFGRLHRNKENYRHEAEDKKGMDETNAEQSKSLGNYKSLSSVEKQQKYRKTITAEKEITRNGEKDKHQSSEGVDFQICVDNHLIAVDDGVRNVSQLKSTFNEDTKIDSKYVRKTENQIKNQINKQQDTKNISSMDTDHLLEGKTCNPGSKKVDTSLTTSAYTRRNVSKMDMTSCSLPLRSTSREELGTRMFASQSKKDVTFSRNTPIQDNESNISTDNFTEENKNFEEIEKIGNVQVTTIQKFHSDMHCDNKKETEKSSPQTGNSVKNRQAMESFQNTKCQSAEKTETYKQSAGNIARSSQVVRESNVTCVDTVKHKNILSEKSDRIIKEDKLFPGDEDCFENDVYGKRNYIANLEKKLTLSEDQSYIKERYLIDAKEKIQQLKERDKLLFSEHVVPQPSRNLKGASTIGTTVTESQIKPALNKSRNVDQKVTRHSEKMATHSEDTRMVLDLGIGHSVKEKQSGALCLDIHRNDLHKTDRSSISTTAARKICGEKDDVHNKCSKVQDTIFSESSYIKDVLNERSDIQYTSMHNDTQKKKEKVNEFNKKYYVTNKEFQNLKLDEKNEENYAEMYSQTTKVIGETKKDVDTEAAAPIEQKNTVNNKNQIHVQKRTVRDTEVSHSIALSSEYPKTSSKIQSCDIRQNTRSASDVSNTINLREKKTSPFTLSKRKNSSNVTKKDPIFGKDLGQVHKTETFFGEVTKANKCPHFEQSLIQMNDVFCEKRNMKVNTNHIVSDLSCLATESNRGSQIEGKETVDCKIKIEKEGNKDDATSKGIDRSVEEQKHFLQIPKCARCVSDICKESGKFKQSDASVNVQSTKGKVDGMFVKKTDKVEQLLLGPVKNDEEKTKPCAKSELQTLDISHSEQKIKEKASSIIEDIDRFSQKDDKVPEVGHHCNENKNMMSDINSAATHKEAEKLKQINANLEGNETVVDVKNKNEATNTDMHRKCRKKGECSEQKNEKKEISTKSLGKKMHSQHCFTLIIFQTLKDEMEVLSCLIGVVSDVKFKIESVDISARNKKTSVTIHFPSLSMAKKFETCLRKKRKEIFPYMFEKQKPGILSQICMQENTRKFMKKAEYVLQIHLAKIEKYEKEYASLSTESSTRKKIKFVGIEDYHMKMQHKKTIHEKIIELKEQRSEFQTSLNQVIEDIQKLNGQTVTQTDFKPLLQKFDIEFTRLEQSLPIYAKRSSLVKTILDNQVCIILGETGSGKSTQIVQYMLQSSLSDCGILVCTQPRKVAATSLATRVANELKTKVGDIVGYQTGMNKKMSTHTKLLYMTDHMLLNECLKDPHLKKFSCIIIDEAHERSIYTDLLLGMIKKCLPFRKDMHVVITSATIDPEVFVNYFGGCPVVKVSGRMFPVEIEWQVSSNNGKVAEDYEIKAVEKTLQIHLHEPPGDILVFLTSQIEIEKCQERLLVGLRGRNDHWVLQLHGKLQADEQNLVFKAAPRGKRKIVLATNIAETSVTISGVKYVIDTGAVKEHSYDPGKKVSLLQVTTVTKSSADQRKGRAGRTGPGKCYRLYSKDDYEEMELNSVPEILKIDMGHAILKLLQLDVDPLEFDFVQAPAKASMENAFQLLTKLGAIENGKISPLGKWIAKLPFEPNLGVLVHDAIDADVGLEGIIIASSCTLSGSLFYRAGSKEQKETSDKLKVPFCHKKGDLFTYLNVFREWHKIPEKQKGIWCRDNSVNGKAVKSIRDAVNEILFILRKDLGIQIKFEIKEVDTNEKILQKLIFKAFQANLCHFLGHEKAGYYFIDKNQQVIMHPSCSFESLAFCPNWVIVERVMKTSRDFALNITAVLDEDVEKAHSEGFLEFNMDDVQRRKVESIKTEFVGSQLHRQFVGPRYTNVKQMEQKLVEHCSDSVFVIDADRNKGEISIYAPVENKNISLSTLEEAIEPLREKIRAEVFEQSIFPNCHHVRVSLGAGGVIQDILGQEDFTKLFVYYTDENIFDVSEVDIRALFSRFGELEICSSKSPMNTNPKYWGFIVYKEARFAKRALQETKGNSFGFRVRPPKGFNTRDSSDVLKAKITWCRRESKGFGFVQIKDADELDRVCLKGVFNKSFVVGGTRAKIVRAKDKRTDEYKIDELFVNNLNKFTDEDVLKESLMAYFGVAEKNIGKVAVIREKVNTTQEQLGIIKRRLQRLIEQNGLLRNKFDVVIKEPRPNDFFFCAYVTFSDPEEGFDICSSLNNTIFMEGHVITVIPEVRTRFFVLQNVYELVEKDVASCCRKQEKEENGVKITITKTTSGNYAIDIDAESVHGMIETRKALQEILHGDELEYENLGTLRNLFTKDGRNKIERITKKTNTVIILDERNTVVSVYGDQTNREDALKKIRIHLDKLSSSKLRIIDLKGEGKPPGVMKAVIIMYGVSLEGLKTSTDLTSVELDHRFHRIKMLGKEECVDKAVKIIDEITEKVAENYQEKKLSSTDIPECGICFCEVPITELYRLESCGHSYCRDCVRLQFESVLKSKEFPLSCSHEGCDMKWAWKDVMNMKNFGFSSLQNIINASVSCFVRENKDKVRYCITPDCPMVYKVNTAGGRITCFVCQTSMCSSCHVEYHTGLSCVMFQMENGTDQTGLRKWMRQDPANRKLCPNCHAGIEKNGGCQHMECRDCKCHICWMCMAFFKTSRECYGHMSREHSTFV